MFWVQGKLYTPLFLPLDSQQGGGYTYGITSLVNYMTNANQEFETAAFNKFQDMLPECGPDELNDYIDSLFESGMSRVAYACIKDWKDFERECDEYRETLDSARDSFNTVL